MPPTRTRPRPYDVRARFVQPAVGGPGGGLTDPQGNPLEPGTTGREFGLVTRDGHVMRRVDPLGQGTFPQTQEYATSDVYKERSFVYRRPYLGMGERTQNGQVTPRYYHALERPDPRHHAGQGPQVAPRLAGRGHPGGAGAGLRGGDSPGGHDVVRPGRALRPAPRRGPGRPAAGEPGPGRGGVRPERLPLVAHRGGLRGPPPADRQRPAVLAVRRQRLGRDHRGGRGRPGPLHPVRVVEGLRLGGLQVRV